MPACYWNDCCYSISISVQKVNKSLNRLPNRLPNRKSGPLSKISNWSLPSLLSDYQFSLVASTRELVRAVARVEGG